MSPVVRTMLNRRLWEGTFGLSPSRTELPKLMANLPDLPILKSADQSGIKKFNKETAIYLANKNRKTTCRIPW